MKEKLNRELCINGHSFTKINDNIIFIGEVPVLRAKLANFKQDKGILPEVLCELLSRKQIPVEFATDSIFNVVYNSICGVVKNIEYDYKTGWLTGLIVPYGLRKDDLLEFYRIDDYLKIGVKGMYQSPLDDIGWLTHSKYTKIISFMVLNSHGWPIKESY